MAVPSPANAGFFSDLLTGEVVAKNEPSVTVNSQNMGLLEANVSSASLSSKKEVVIESKESITSKISDDALLPSISPLSLSAGGVEVDDSGYSEISVYVVRSGDSIGDIAKMFKVSTNTILWANDMKKGEKLVVGDTLIILPVDGVNHIVKKGDTIKNIAKIYGVEVGDIYQYNGLDDESVLSIGDEIIIPGAEIKEVEKKNTTISSKNKSNSSIKIKTGGNLPNNYYSADNSGSADGYFIKPVTGGSCRLTQGKHDRYAVDIGCPTGTPIKASASGKVIFSKVGWNGAFGNLVIISHPNGTQTFYAHQSKIAVSVGDQVSRGEVIGYVGNTGRSTGPHLHFEVRGARNPGFDNSWAK